MNKAYLGLGSNLNNPVEQLSLAITSLASFSHSKVMQVSSFYQTKPVGFISQPDFINAVIEITTSLNPHSLLAELQLLEKQQGRIRDGNLNQPRTLDLDILIYNKELITGPQLTLPHPRLSSRAFVLIPLAEIAPDLELPLGEKIKDLLASLPAENLAEVIRLEMEPLIN